MSYTLEMILALPGSTKTSWNGHSITKTNGRLVDYFELKDNLWWLVNSYENTF